MLPFVYGPCLPILAWRGPICVPCRLVLVLAFIGNTSESCIFISNDRIRYKSKCNGVNCKRKEGVFEMKRAYIFFQQTKKKTHTHTRHE